MVRRKRNLQLTQSKIIMLADDKKQAELIGHITSGIDDCETQHLSFAEFNNTKKQNGFDCVIASILSGDATGIGVLQDIGRNWPDCKMIVISDDLSEAEFRQLLHLGVKDWLKLPLDQGALKRALQSLMHSETDAEGKVYAVHGASGGVGTTITAITLAALLSEEKKTAGKIALIDLDFSSANCGEYLDLRTDQSLIPMLENPERIDQEFVDLMRQEVADGFSVYSFLKPDIAQHPKGTEFVLRMLDAISNAHRFTILDLPYYYTPWLEDVLASVNDATIVTRDNLPALKAARIKANAIDTRNKSLRILSNRHAKKLLGKTLGKREVQQIFGATPIWVAPDEQVALDDAINQGVSLLRLNPRARFIKAMRKFRKEWITT